MKKLFLIGCLTLMTAAANGQKLRIKAKYELQPRPYGGVVTVTDNVIEMGTYKFNLPQSKFPAEEVKLTHISESLYYDPGNLNKVNEGKISVTSTFYKGKPQERTETSEYYVHKDGENYWRMQLSYSAKSNTAKKDMEFYATTQRPDLSTTAESSLVPRSSIKYYDHSKMTDWGPTTGLISLPKGARGQITHFYFSPQQTNVDIYTTEGVKYSFKRNRLDGQYYMSGPATKVAAAAVDDMKVIAKVYPKSKSISEVGKILDSQVQR